jgi:hypothetical protein
MWNVMKKHLESPPQARAPVIRHTFSCKSKRDRQCLRLVQPINQTKKKKGNDLLDEIKTHEKASRTAALYQRALSFKSFLHPRPLA